MDIPGWKPVKSSSITIGRSLIDVVHYNSLPNLVKRIVGSADTLEEVQHAFTNIHIREIVSPEVIRHLDFKDIRS